ncbi:MAG TPA: CopG family transcriptional regulator [Candidatus Dormibacteraeota bacterium]|jgi:hypothetical protein
MASTRTQVYLTEEQRRRIDDIVARDGHSLAWIVREALDIYLAGPAPDRRQALDATFGAVPDIAVPPREEWNRHPAGRNALVPAGGAPGTAPRSVARKQK